jgi:hypothetical protein
MEGNLAAVVGQFQVTPDLPASLRVDSRELLASTTRLLGARLGEIEIDTYLAITARYVELGKPADGKCHSTLRALAKTLYNGEVGGTNRAQVSKALINLYRVEIQMAGVWAGTNELDEAFLDFERILNNLRFHEQIARGRKARELLDPAVIGAQRDSTVQWQFADWHTRQIRDGYWIELDWDRLRSLTGAAKMLWLILSAPRFQFTPSAGGTDLEELCVPLSPESYRALGIRASRPRDCRRTLDEAGQRIVAVDDTYVDFSIVPDPQEPRQRVLRVLRRRSNSQLQLTQLTQVAS